MSIYNTLVFTKEGSNEIEGLKLRSEYSGEMVFSLDRHDSEVSLWDDVLNFIKRLIKNDYACEVYEEDTGTIIVRYSHNGLNEPYGGPCLRWLNQDELDYLDEYRQIIADDLTRQLKQDVPTKEEKELQGLLNKSVHFHMMDLDPNEQ